jgi:hypothetical protein
MIFANDHSTLGASILQPTAACAVMSEIGRKRYSRHLHRLVGIEYRATNVSKNHLRAILCGILFLLSAGVGRAQDSAVKDTVHIDAKSFRCITEMTHVRQFYVDNLLGNLDATLAVANSTTAVRIQRAPSYNWFRPRPW